MKYPIGIQDFVRLRDSGYVYVDKTALIYDLVTQGSVYFLSRPRRFGKSLLLSTLEAYYRGRKDLFEGLAIADLEKDWIEHPVFKIDFNGDDYTEPGVLESVLDGYLRRWEAVYGQDPFMPGLGNRFAYVLQRAYEQSGRRAVVLIDEYDKPILDALHSGKTCKEAGAEAELLEDRHRNVLKAFYSTFKKADGALQFVLLTGITKFSQVSVFSGFNQPNDISLDSHYEGLCGISQEELICYFKDEITKLAESESCSYDAMLGILKLQYDGYHFGPSLVDIFNPHSLFRLFYSRHIENYWCETGAPTYLVRLLEHCDKSIIDLTGKYYRAETFINYSANVERPLPMIYQSGYLTIKRYDPETQTYLLDFPNIEVRSSFLSLLAGNYLEDWSEEVIAKA